MFCFTPSNIEIFGKRDGCWLVSLRTIWLLKSGLVAKDLSKSIIAGFFYDYYRKAHYIQ